MTASDRPKDSGLRHMRLPVGAYASILHRITGILLIGVLVLALALLRQSLSNASAFHAVQYLIARPWARGVGMLAVWVIAQHLYGGIRHLLLDGDIGFGRPKGRRSATWVMGLAVATALLAAIIWP